MPVAQRIMSLWENQPRRVYPSYLLLEDRWDSGGHTHTELMHLYLGPAARWVPGRTEDLAARD